MARRVKDLLGPDFFVRRDKFSRALFVSDYPARADEAAGAELDHRLITSGFEVERAGGLALIDLGFEACRAFLEELADKTPANDFGLAAIFDRHPLAFAPDMRTDARKALLLWDKGRVAQLQKMAGEALAIALRLKQPVPMYYPLLLNSLKNAAKEEEIC